MKGARIVDLTLEDRRMSNLLISGMDLRNAAKLLCFLSVSSADRPGFRSAGDNASTNIGSVEDCVMLVEKAFWVFSLTAD